MSAHPGHWWPLGQQGEQPALAGQLDPCPAAEATNSSANRGTSSSATSRTAGTNAAGVTSFVMSVIFFLPPAAARDVTPTRNTDFSDGPT